MHAQGAPTWDLAYRWPGSDFCGQSPIHPVDRFQDQGRSDWHPGVESENEIQLGLHRSDVHAQTLTRAVGRPIQTLLFLFFGRRIWLSAAILASERADGSVTTQAGLPLGSHPQNRTKVPSFASLLVLGVAVLTVIGLCMGIWSPVQHSHCQEDHSESDEDFLARERAAQDDD